MPKRTVYYRRAVWFDQEYNLQQLIAQAHQNHPTTDERTFDDGEYELQGAKFDPARNGLHLVHVSQYVRNQPTATIQNPSQDVEGDTDTQAPPQDKSYVHGDVFLALRNNHVLICTSGARESAGIHYLEHLLRADGRGNIVPSLNIDPIANVDKARLIQQEGVSSVNMQASLYEATVRYEERRSMKTRMMSRIGEEIRAIFADDDALNEIGERENLTVKLTVSYDSRKKGGEMGRERLEATANDLVRNDDEGFSIVTGSGQTLTHDEIRLKRVHDFNDKGNTIFRDDAWRALVNYYNELEANGQLEQ